MGFQRKRITRRYRVAILRERVETLEEKNANVEQKEKSLEDTKEQVRLFNRHFILSD